MPKYDDEDEAALEAQRQALADDELDNQDSLDDDSASVLPGSMPPPSAGPGGIPLASARNPALPTGAGPAGTPLASAINPAQSPPKPDDDVLKRYFARNQKNTEDLAGAEDLASKNRLLARMGGAFNTIGAGLAGNAKPDNSGFENLAKDAENPIARVERERRNAAENDRTVTQYLTQKIKAEQLAKNQGDKIKNQSDLANQKSKDYNSRTGAISGLAQARLGLQQDRLGLQTDSKSMAVANDIHNDKSLAGAKQRYESVLRGVHNTTDDMNMSTAHEVLQDYAAALSGQNASSNYKISSISPSTLQEEIAKWEQFYKSDPNQPAPAGLIKFLRTQGPRLLDSFEGSIKAEANTKGKGKNYSNAQLKKAAEDARNYYSNGDYFKETKGQFFGNTPPAWLNAKRPGFGSTTPTPAAVPVFSDNEKEKRYQEWKSKQ